MSDELRNMLLSDCLPGPRLSGGIILRRCPMQKLVGMCSLVLFSALILLLALDCAAQQPKTPAPSPQQHAVPPPAPKSQEQFLVYWTAEAGWNTELLLRNNLEASPLIVTPALRTPDGAETSLPA